jgi:hypothetical protein
MKNLITITLVLLTLTVNSQEVPQNGKRVIKVKQKFEGEYNQKVRGFFHDKMEVTISDKLPKKLAKYGFTNVKVNEIGVVTSTDAWYNKLADIAPLSNKERGIILLNQANTVGGMARAVDVYVTPDTNTGPTRYQINFTSDQGSFKLRINMFGGVKYLIKESNVQVNIQDGKIVSKEILNNG